MMNGWGVTHWTVAPLMTNPLLMNKMKRKTLFGLTTTVTAGLLTLGASTAMAQDRGPTLMQNYEPLAGADAIFSVDGSDISSHMEITTGAQLIFANDELNLADDVAEIDDRFYTDLLFSVGMADRLEVGLGLPVYFDNSGIDASGNDLDDTEIGDLRVRPKLSLVDSGEYPLGLAIYSQVGIPTGDRGNLTGTEQFYVQPGVIVDAKEGDLQVAANAGVRLQRDDTFAGFETGPMLTYGLGAEYEIVDNILALSGELFGYTDAENPWQTDVNSPLEGLAGVKFYERNTGLVFQAAGGGAVIDGVNAPDYRVMGGISFASGRSDLDNDGIISRNDDCPRDAEDMDGFRDMDGCPDLDNDGDGIADASDLCPMQAEDMDDFNDADGCPDLDNDLDGIADVNDACPNTAGLDGKGCPVVAQAQDRVVINNQIPVVVPEQRVVVEQPAGEPTVDQRVIIQDRMIRMIGQAFFDTDEWKIRELAKPMLDEFAQVLIDYPEIKTVQVIGNADHRYTAEYNEWLSRKRAESVKNYLVNRGVAAERLELVALGESNPQMEVPEQRGELRQERLAANRRVQFKITEYEPGFEDIEELSRNIRVETIETRPLSEQEGTTVQ